MNWLAVVEGNGVGSTPWFSVDSSQRTIPSALARARHLDALVNPFALELGDRRQDM
jgi:hypothetical protein